MSIFFQFGEFFSENSDGGWLKDLLITTIGAAIGTGGALYIFYKDQKSKRLQREREEVELNQNRIENFLHLANISSKSIKTQTTVFEVFLKEIRNKPLQDQRLRYKLIVDLKRIVELDYEQLRKSFISNYGDTSENKKRFRRLYHYLEYLYYGFEDIRRVIKVNQDDIFNLKIAYKNDFELIQNLSARFIRKIRKENLAHYRKIPEYERINSIIINFHKGWSNKSDLDYTYTSYIQPIKFAFLDYCLSYDDAVDILEFAKRLSITRNEIKINARNLYKEVYKYNLSFKRVVSKIDLILSELKFNELNTS